MYGLAAIIVLTLVALLTKWLLHRGAISTQQHNRSRKRESVVDAVNVSTTLSLSAIKQLPPKEQSVALLTSAIFHLKNKGHLPNNKALSNHQLNQHLQQHNLSLAADFSNLLTHVEPVIYGNITPSEPLLNDCWQSVTSLIKP